MLRFGGVFDRFGAVFGAETIENGAETIENGAETIENDAETIEHGAETKHLNSIELQGPLGPCSSNRIQMLKIGGLLRIPHRSFGDA